MIEKIISRYRPRYIRSLVYMLQASEYDVREYLKWMGRVKNFGKVENRKQLKKSPKALVIILIIWAVWIGVVLLGVYAAMAWGGVLGYSVLALIGLTSPYLVAYMLAVIVAVIQIAQKPLEMLIIKSAKRKISKHNATKIAIAGSYGKTTMREIIKTILSEGKKVAAPPSNFNTPLSISRFIKKLDGDEEIIIFELGEYYPGDVRKLCKLVGPDIGVITGVNEAHLDKFKNVESTVKTIFELADYLGDKPIYVNAESKLAESAASEKDILYSRNGVGGWKVEKPKTDLSGTSFTLIKEKEILNLKSKLLGMHQIGPISAAAVIASELGLSNDQIKKGVADTEPFEHRLERKEIGDGVIILDDSYNGNPDGVKAVIDFLGALKGRRFYVTPGLVEMGEKTKEVHVDIGRQLAKSGVEKVVLIKNSVTPYVEEGLKDGHYQGEVLWFNKALEAYNAIPHLTVHGDIVLLQNDWPDQYE